jgi:hypothetical protein
VTNVPKKSDGWGLIADYIIRKEKDGSWSHADISAESIPFTRWGLEQAKAIGISKYSFWQFRRAGLLYNMLIDTLPQEHQIPLHHLSSVTPENLNELQKISRVAPAEMYKELCERVIVKKNITRKELRSLWASLRPAMGGETARGRKNKRSFDIRISDKDEHAQSLLINGLVLLAIKDRATKIFGNDSDPNVIDCREQYRPFPSNIVDALVLCNSDPHGFNVDTHGISLGWPRSQDALSMLNIENPSCPCDFLWLVYTRDKTTKNISDYALVPDYVGIIEADIDSEAVAISSLQIKQRPKPNHIQYLHKQAIGLLQKFLKNNITTKY